MCRHVVMIASVHMLCSVDKFHGLSAGGSYDRSSKSLPHGFVILRLSEVEIEGIVRVEHARLEGVILHGQL